MNHHHMRNKKPPLPTIILAVLLTFLCLTFLACNDGDEPSDVGTDARTDTVAEATRPDTALPSDAADSETAIPDPEITLDPETPSEPIVTEADESTAAPETEVSSSGSSSNVVTLAPPEPVTEPTTDQDGADIPKEEMPRIDITTEGGQSIHSKDYYVNSTISVSRCDEAYILTDCAAGIRVRGNSTAGAPKKPYRIKFETKQSMLGLNDGEKFKSWCLMADYFDSSMLRTWATFAFAELLLGGKYYSSDCTPVEVYVNGEYMGVYLLCEQTQIDNDLPISYPCAFKNV